MKKYNGICLGGPREGLLVSHYHDAYSVMEYTQHKYPYTSEKITFYHYIPLSQRIGMWVHESLDFQGEQAVEYMVHKLAEKYGKDL